VRQCQVPGCTHDAAFEVFLYQYAGHPGRSDVRSKLDPTCPFICDEHAAENESGALGERNATGGLEYPYTNLERAHALTIYRPMEPASGGFPAPDF
jgi:hypothetical protein